jgi:HEAT repeat protein
MFLILAPGFEPSRIDHSRSTDQLNGNVAQDQEQDGADDAADSTLEWEKLHNTIDWEKLRDPDAQVRRAACEEFRRLPPSRELRRSTPAISAALVEMLNDPDADVRDEACTSLVFIVEPTKITALIEALESTNANCRYGAANSLGRIGQPNGFYGDATPATEPLKKLLTDELVKIRLCAAWALVNVGAEEPEALDILASGLASGDKGQIWWGLRGFKDCHWKSKEFFDQHRPASLVGSLLRILSRDLNPNFRQQAANLIGDCHDCSDRVIATLSAALADAEWEVRYSAAYSFSELLVKDPPTQVFEILCEDMNKRKSWIAVRDTCKALERFDQFPPCVVENLSKHVGDDDRENRLRIACLLSRCPLDFLAEVEQVVASCFHETPESYLRLEAIKALGRTGFKSPAARKIVEDARNDEAQVVRDAAEMVIRSGSPK